MNRVLTIAGMHRSGTSLVASALNDCGVVIGDKLVAPNQRNPRGFYEDNDFLEFHGKLLADRGLDVLLEKDFVFTPNASELKIARQLILQRHELAFWGWKEPRTTLFLDLWGKVIPNLRVIVLYRHPFDVWLSLLRAGDAGKLSLSSAMAAWTIYNLRALDFAQKHPERCLVVNINAAINDPVAFGQAIAQLTGLDATLVKSALVSRLVPNDFRAPATSQRLSAQLEGIFPATYKLFTDLEKYSALPGPPATHEASHLLDAVIPHLLACESTIREQTQLTADQLEWARKAEAKAFESAKLVDETRGWATKTEALFKTEKLRAADFEKWALKAQAQVAINAKLLAENRTWAEKAEADLTTERKRARDLEAWAKKAEKLLAIEKQRASDFEKWALKAEAALASERALSAELKNWAETAEARILKEQEIAQGHKAWAERTEAFLEQARKEAATNGERVARLELSLAAIKTPIHSQ